MTTRENTEILINNAGLVLYSPFLPRFFEQLALMEEGEFVNEESRNRAIYLLQYLAYSRTDFPEYELVLNKMLVGMSLDDTLSPPISLIDKEYEVSRSLMNGFISNWDKVRNSSPEAIQETFIQRGGILRFSEDKMDLAVNNSAVDVLIHSIPWNISEIKLPWMIKPIHIDWI